MLQRGGRSERVTCPADSWVSTGLGLSMSKERILVVDDEANARTALAELLKEEGYSVETAADGFKALSKFEEGHPDLILTDLKMPGMDGVELLEKVRQSDPDVEVVVMTAFGAVDTAVQAISEAARTGKVGDGKIFITPLQDVIRIRTGEAGADAV